MRIERLTRAHNRTVFDCGEESLNRFLREFARKNAQNDLGVTYVLIDDSDPTTIRGYYTLVVAEVANGALPAERQTPLTTVPAALLARLATDIHYRGAGYGQLLVADFISRVLHISEEAGIHLMVVDALNERAREFYQKHFGFEALEDDPNHLYLPIKTARKT